jgi:hypothetical protein
MQMTLRTRPNFKESKRVKRSLYLFFIFIGSLQSPWLMKQGFAIEAPADQALIRFPQNEPQIPSLAWKDLTASIKNISEGGVDKSYAVIEGTYPVKDSILLANSFPVKITDNGEFTIAAPLTGNFTMLSLKTVDVLGAVSTQRVYIQKLEREKPFERIRVGVQLGVSTISFTETGLDNINEISLVTKADLTYTLSPHYSDIGINAYYTALILTKNNETSLQFVGANLRYARTIFGAKTPWQVRLMGGWYFTSTLVDNDAYGYKNVSGPMIFPVLRHTIDQDKSWFIYGKYSPVSSGFSFSLATGSSEIAGGGGYTWTIGKSTLASVTLDASKLSLVDTQSGLSVENSTLGLGFSLNF